MKRTPFTLLTMGGAIAATALLASAYTVREYKMAVPEPLHIPAVPDSVMKENPFKPEDLLKARTSLPYEAAGWTTILSDSTGRVETDGFDDNVPRDSQKASLCSTLRRARQSK